MKLQVSVAVSTPLLLAMILLSHTSVSAAEPSWYPFVVARGADRIAIQNTPMHKRPYRPMHIYGNAVRRGYYRDNSVTMPRGLAGQTRILTGQPRSFNVQPRGFSGPARGLTRSNGILLRR